MDRRTGDEWSGHPKLLAALEEYLVQMLQELGEKDELAGRYPDTPRLDRMFKEWLGDLKRHSFEN